MVKNLAGLQKAERLQINMKLRTVRLQSQLDDLLYKLDWSHAFIREVFILSPSYVTGEELTVVAPDAKPTIKLMISCQDKIYPGIELVLEEVEDIYLSFQTDLEPIGTVNERDGSVRLRLYEQESTCFQAKSLSYALLDERSWGWKVRYGTDKLFDKGGVSIMCLQKTK
jgi:hypothetical protein